LTTDLQILSLQIMAGSSGGFAPDRRTVVSYRGNDLSQHRTGKVGGAFVYLQEQGWPIDAAGGTSNGS